MSVAALLLWGVAGVVAFLPFAFDTSPWDAVRLRVPGNQGNWWHVLVGLPFFLAYPMMWLRAWLLFARQSVTAMQRNLLWSAIAVSAVGTLLVEAPFVLHLAGTGGWPRLRMLSLGLGTIFGSAAVLWLRRRSLSAAQACMAGMGAAYLGNAALCLVVYAGAAGSAWSRVGWTVTMVLVWPMAVELGAALFGSLFGKPAQA